MSNMVLRDASASKNINLDLDIHKNPTVNDWTGLVGALKDINYLNNCLIIFSCPTCLSLIPLFIYGPGLASSM